jgi:hypothetical protein
MHKRMLQILAGLLAVGALTAVPAGASVDAPPTAKAADDCDSDNYAPNSRFGDNWSGRDGNGYYWRGWHDGDGYFGGRSYDDYCNSADRLGKVDRVMVAVKRKRGSECQHLLSTGHLGRRADCGHTHWMKAHGTDRWHHRIATRLPRGHYMIHRRAVDAAGNREKLHTRHLRIR